MSYSATVYKIMISSPSDVVTEREIIHKTIHTWNACNSEKDGIVLLPIDWQNNSTPEMGSHPQAIINKSLVLTSDLLIAVFWHRIGSPTLKAESGTIEEINEFIATQKPTMLYFSQKPIPHSHDQTQLEKLRKFKEECRPSGLFSEYSNDREFEALISRNLSSKVNELISGKTNVTTEEQLPPLAEDMLEKAIQKNWFIIRTGDYSFRVKDNFYNTRKGYTPSDLTYAFHSLIKNELIFLSKNGSGCDKYGVTPKGLDYFR